MSTVDIQQSQKLKLSLLCLNKLINSDVYHKSCVIFYLGRSSNQPIVYISSSIGLSFNTLCLRFNISNSSLMNTVSGRNSRWQLDKSAFVGSLAVACKQEMIRESRNMLDL